MLSPNSTIVFGFEVNPCILEVKFIMITIQIIVIHIIHTDSIYLILTISTCKMSGETI